MAGIIDNDELDLTGTWTMTVGYTYETLLVDADGHFTPPGPNRPFTVEFTFREDSQDGKIYEGKTVGYPGKLTARTYYRNQGRQIVELLSEHDQTVELLSGAHIVYDPKSTGVHVVGGWVNCGGGKLTSPLPGNPYLGWFKLDKSVPA